MVRWYLIHSKSGREATAQCQLERQGYEVYLPLVSQTVRRRGQWRESTCALFPRYLFVGVEEGRQSLAPARSTVGVTNVVRLGGNYAVVPDQIIRELQELADPETGLHRLCQASVLAPGAPVKVSAGPFDGLEGVFQRHAGDERVIILLDILGQAASVRVPCRFVRPMLALQ